MIDCRTLTRAFLAIGCLRAVANRDRLRVSRSTGTLHRYRSPGPGDGHLRSLGRAVTKPISPKPGNKPWSIEPGRLHVSTCNDEDDAYRGHRGHPDSPNRGYLFWQSMMQHPSTHLDGAGGNQFARPTRSLEAGRGEFVLASRGRHSTFLHSAGGRPARPRGSRRAGLPDSQAPRRLGNAHKDAQDFCYDQRGCGKSTRPFDRFTSNYYSNMTELERTLGIGAQVATSSASVAFSAKKSSS